MAKEGPAPSSRFRLPAISLAGTLLGLGLLIAGVQASGGSDRQLPFYGFPEPAYGCDRSRNAGPTTEEPPELRKSYSEAELLRCYPEGMGTYYVLGVGGAALFLVSFGTLMWSLWRNHAFSHPRRAALTGVALLPLGGFLFIYSIILAMADFELIGGSPPRPSDPFDLIAGIFFWVGPIIGLGGVTLVLRAVGQAAGRKPKAVS